METNHEIFVEGNFVGEDGETTKRDITTTQIYTHVDDRHLSKVHDLLDE
jgi:hypothetical protein